MLAIDEKYFPAFRQEMIDVGDGIKLIPLSVERARKQFCFFTGTRKVISYGAFYLQN